MWNSRTGWAAAVSLAAILNGGRPLDRLRWAPWRGGVAAGGATFGINVGLYPR